MADAGAADTSPFDVTEDTAPDVVAPDDADTGAADTRADDVGSDTAVDADAGRDGAFDASTDADDVGRGDAEAEADAGCAVECLAGTLRCNDTGEREQCAIEDGCPTWRPMACGDGLTCADDGESVRCVTWCDPDVACDPAVWADTCDGGAEVRCQTVGDCFERVRTECASDVCVEGLCVAEGCGDGVRDWEEGVERCDDGDNVGGDGCDPWCSEEPGWFCGGDPSWCREVTCGDYVVEGWESCDDGNDTPLDGCSATCHIELPSPRRHRIVPGLVEATDPMGAELDGSCNPTGQMVPVREYWFENATDALAVLDRIRVSPWYGDRLTLHRSSYDPDDPSASCVRAASLVGTSPDVALPVAQYQTVSPHGRFVLRYTPAWPRTSVTPFDMDIDVAGCGDGRVDRIDEVLFEGCDDGNAVPGDGCSPECTVDPGWHCPRSPQPSGECAPAVCGDGVIAPAYEQCDDGNPDEGDGCSATCVVEANWWCEMPRDGESSVCWSGLCGNGIIDGFEGCDDGNTLEGDGCAPDCVVEFGPGAEDRVEGWDAVDAEFHGAYLNESCEHASGASWAAWIARGYRNESMSRITVEVWAYQEAYVNVHAWSGSFDRGAPRDRCIAGGRVEPWDRSTVDLTFDVEPGERFYIGAGARSQSFLQGIEWVVTARRAEEAP